MLSGPKFPLSIVAVIAANSIVWGIPTVLFCLLLRVQIINHGFYGYQVILPGTYVFGLILGAVVPLLLGRAGRYGGATGLALSALCIGLPWAGCGVFGLAMAN